MFKPATMKISASKSTVDGVVTGFVRLPNRLQRDIVGGCQCTWCTCHPGLAPKWDVLAVDSSGHTWTVHYPELDPKESVGL